MTMSRRSLLGAAALGAVVTAAGRRESAGRSEGGYASGEPISIGLGKGDAASLTLVWVPPAGQQPISSLKARLVLFGLDGKALVEKNVTLAPYTGASIDLPPNVGAERLQVFSYAFIEGFNEELREQLFGALEVYDPADGRTRFAAAPAGLG